MTRFTSALSAAALLLASAQTAPTLKQRDTQQCGDATYDTLNYICYNDDFLCPVINGSPTKLCGQACYSENMYSCNNNVLSTLPSTNGPFTLTASNPTAPFNGETVEASGLHFYIGAGPGSYCPVPSVPQATCDTYPGTNTTMFSSALAVVVPGGQQTYWQNNGALAFTQAHSAATYNLSYYGSSVFEGGAYFGPNNEQLTACPSGDSGSVWQVFARLAGLTFADDCVDFYAVVRDEPSGTLGAWQYV